jgi:hypothetical protein
MASPSSRRSSDSSGRADRGLAAVELSRDHVGDEALAVFAEEFDFAGGGSQVWPVSGVQISLSSRFPPMSVVLLMLRNALPAL